MPISEIGNALGNPEDGEVFLAEKMGKVAWGADNINFRTLRYQGIVEEFRRDADQFEIALHPTGAPGIYAYIDGRHRAVISEKLAPGRPIRARLVITGRDFKRVFGWVVTRK